jgi:hypothetical protein
VLPLLQSLPSPPPLIQLLFLSSSLPLSLFLLLLLLKEEKYIEGEKEEVMSRKLKANGDKR